ncbi:V-type ATP synthase subunit D [Candidatus Micrarchaeota archaeon]|nr:V-type ATP synthase subunit D [Candidatus Micrarchaeota archaeon]
MKENVKPTRMELLNTKQRLKLAEKGHALLKQKRDALVLEFFAVVKQAKNLRNELNAKVIEANKALAIAEAFHGKTYLETLALSAFATPELAVQSKNIMGVRIPLIKIDETIQSKELAFAIEGSSAKLDDAILRFQEATDLVLKIAETEAAIKRLLQEIEKTNRRVNALEYNIQPDLKKTIKDITQHLALLEGELFFALKVTKKRLQKKAEASQ